MKFSELSDAGINLAEGIKRFSGHDELYRKCLRIFMEDSNFRVMCDSIENKDAATAFQCAHTLKGVVGNLSMDKFYNDICPLVEVLRSGETENIGDMLATVKEDYNAIVTALKSCDL